MWPELNLIMTFYVGDNFVYMEIGKAVSSYVVDGNMEGG